MTTSPLEYRVLLPGSAGYVAANEPLDAFTARNYLLNNACNYADGYGQTLVAWTKGASQDPLTVDDPIVATGVPYVISQWACPLRIRAGGGSYQVRVRLAGASTTNEQTVRFFACLAVPGRFSLNAVYDGTGFTGTDFTTRPMSQTNRGDAVFMASTESTSAAWLTGESQGTNAWESMIALTPEQVAEQLELHSTVTTIGGDDIGVRYLDTNLIVFGVAEESLTNFPLLHGVYACEWIGT